MGKFSNPAIPHLIKPMDLFLEIGFLPFLEEYLLIMGENLQRSSSGDAHSQRRKVNPPNSFQKKSSISGATLIIRGGSAYLLLRQTRG